MKYRVGEHVFIDLINERRLTIDDLSSINHQR
jgi:hypothetical protein